MSEPVFRKPKPAWAAGLAAMLLAWRAAHGAEPRGVDHVVPVIASPFWSIAGNPDLGPYTTPNQQPVDFGVWQAADETWQLWSCIRHTACGGHTRLFYRWEGTQLTDSKWRPMGIAMEARPDLGEEPGGLQAPHVVRWQGRYWMAYGNWKEICFATSEDGMQFQRRIGPDGRTGVFGEGPNANTRDPMLIRIGDLWYCYYTANPRRRGRICCRTSPDLERWSYAAVVCYGGRVGTSPWQAECPHVVEVEPGRFLLFRNQYYGRRARNWVYQSFNPLDFCIDDDSGLVTSLPVAAPEVIHHEGTYFLACLKPELDGIQMARLQFVKLRPAPQPVFDFDDPAVRRQWQVVEGDLPAPFTSSTRSDFRPPQRHFIGTAETPADKLNDRLTGVIRSPPFRLDSPWYYLYVSGGATEDAYVAIVPADGGEPLARFTGDQSNMLRPQLFGAGERRGATVRIEVVDCARAAWGHVNFGGLYAAEQVWRK